MCGQLNNLNNFFYTLITIIYSFLGVFCSLSSNFSIYLIADVIVRWICINKIIKKKNCLKFVCFERNVVQINPKQKEVIKLYGFWSFRPKMTSHEDCFFFFSRHFYHRSNWIYLVYFNFYLREEPKWRQNKFT